MMKKQLATQIGGWVFAGCDSLVSITICEGFEKTGDYAFEHYTIQI